MPKPISMGPPADFVMSIHAGASSAGVAVKPHAATFQGVPVYDWFTLRLRREASTDKPEFRAELVYRILKDRVVFAAVVVEPLQLEVDEVLNELRSIRPLDWWKRYALKAIASKFAQEIFDPDGPYALPGDDQTAEVEAVNLATSTMSLARRSNRIDDAHLSEVARVYAEAWKAKENPTETVRNHFRTTYSTAARWVGKARKAGKIGPPAGPHGGTWSDDLS